MSKYLFYTTFFTGFLLIEMSGQNRLILNQNVFTVLNNSVYLVVNNSNTNAVTTIGTGGSIISETENNTMVLYPNPNNGLFTIEVCKNNVPQEARKYGLPGHKHPRAGNYPRQLGRTCAARLTVRS